jgi:hypothetical protein
MTPAQSQRRTASEIAVLERLAHELHKRREFWEKRGRLDCVADCDEKIARNTEAIAKLRDAAQTGH